MSNVEQCDDGNIKIGDGCDTYCKVESGFQCTTNYSALVNNVCTEICGDSKHMGVNQCDDGNTISGDGCSSACMIESGFTWTGGTTTKRDTCTETCGDSKNMGVNEWDDGNLKNGDGWSSTCELETCYQCIGGTSTSTDVWSLLYIVPNITSVTSGNTVVVSFSYAMKQASISLNDLQVTISSSYTIDFSWSASYSNTTTLNIAISTNTVLQGNEKVTVSFVNYKKFRSSRGGWLTLLQLSATLNSNMVTSTEAVNSMSGFAQYTAYTGIVVTVVLVIVGGGSLEMIWALLNTMQIISYLPLMTEYFPNHVRIMFQLLKFANMNFDILKQLFQIMIWINIYSSVPYNDIFSQNGIDSWLIVDNWGSVLMTMIAYFCLFIVAVIFYKLPCFGLVRRIGNYIVSLFLFNFVLRFMTEGYIELTFGSTLNLFAFKFSSTVEVVSLVLSGLLAVVLFLFPFMSFVMIYDKRRDIANEHELYLKRFGTMYENLKTDKGWEYLEFYPLFLLRRLIFVWLLIMLEGYSEIQWNIFITSSFMVNFNK